MANEQNYIPKDIPDIPLPEQITNRNGETFIKTKDSVVKDIGGIYDPSFNEKMFKLWKKIQEDPESREIFNKYTTTEEKSYILMKSIMEYYTKHPLKLPSQSNNPENSNNAKVAGATLREADKNPNDNKVNTELGIIDNGKETSTISEDENGQLYKTSTSSYYTDTDSITNIEENTGPYDINTSYMTDTSIHPEASDETTTPNYDGELSYEEQSPQTEQLDSPAPQLNRQNTRRLVRQPNYLLNRQGTITIFTIVIIISSLVIGLSIGKILAYLIK